MLLMLDMSNYKVSVSFVKHLTKIFVPSPICLNDTALPRKHSMRVRLYRTIKEAAIIGSLFLLFISFF